MQVTGEMIEAFQAGSGYGRDISADAVRAGLEAVFAEQIRVEKSEWVLDDDGDRWWQRTLGVWLCNGDRDDAILSTLNLIEKYGPVTAVSA